tara:strand:+ start:7 stop:180 length:174 start_codon:yes stop_codon:yes gene_type:complete
LSVIGSFFEKTLGNWFKNSAKIRIKTYRLHVISINAASGAIAGALFLLKEVFILQVF